MAAYTGTRSALEKRLLGLAPGKFQTGSMMYLACACAIACFACLSSMQAAAAPVAASIGAAVAGVEWHLERAERCQVKADFLQRRLERLRAYPEINAAAIADTQTRLLTNQKCVKSSTARASSLELTLASLRGQMVSDTRADIAVLASHIDSLRTAEREHATLALDIRLVQFQIDQLRRALPVNDVALNQKISILEGLRSSLIAVVATIASANRTLADFEASALALFSSRSATLNWSVPTTRENGAPLAVGELGGFEIYMLAESTGHTSVFTLGEPMTTTHTVEGLLPDTYHFSISAYDLEGAFSPLSEVVTKTVR